MFFGKPGRSRAVKWVVAVSTLVMTVPMLARPSSAQPAEPFTGTLAGNGSLYADDDETVVVTTTVDAQVALPAGTSIGAHGLVDVISAASVDVVTNATPSFDEVRLEAGMRAGWWLTDTFRLGGAVVRSQENDWLSYTPSVEMLLDLAKRNTQLTGGVAYSYNEVGRAEDPNFEKRLDNYSLNAGISQILDKKTVAALRYTFQLARGYQSSPYRFIFGRNFGVLERHPEQRGRHAYSLNVLRYLVPDVALDASYRFYFDEWDVTSHTLTAALRWRVTDHWDLRLRARGYYQSSAEFWREEYERRQAFMSADRELSTFFDLGGGPKVTFHAGPLEVAAKADVVHYRFLDFAPLSSRTAVVADLGATLSW